MTLTWKRLAVAVAAVAALGVAVAAVGVVPIRASDGHWAVTEWVLHTAMRRSVAFHSSDEAVPDLDDPAMITRGAAHFELGCRPCHGSPAAPVPRVARAMSPPPPDLAASTDGWSTRELFYVVKYGVKYTGMPAWPAQQRDDEVWAVVAFLRAYRRLGDAGYQRAVATPPAERIAAPLDLSPPPEVAGCARCHGGDGQGRGGVAPSIAGQSEPYLAASLAAYASGRRHSGMMEAVAVELRPETVHALAAYYARLPPRAADRVDPRRAESVSRGAALARRGDPARRVPACVGCHGPREGARNPRYPTLTGQHAGQLGLQLRLFRRGLRGGTDHAGLMLRAARGLTDGDALDLARYYATLPPATAVPSRP